MLRSAAVPRCSAFFMSLSAVVPGPAVYQDAYVSMRGKVKLLVVGHADQSCGGLVDVDCDRYNLELSAQRAREVRTLLISLGVPADDIDDSYDDEEEEGEDE